MFLSGDSGKLQQRGGPESICRMAGRAGPLFGKRKAERSRRGTPCHPYTAFFKLGASFGAHPFLSGFKIILLAELAENNNRIYQKYNKLEDDIHIQTRHKQPIDNKKAAFMPPRSTRVIRCPHYSFWILYRCVPKTCRSLSAKAVTGCLSHSPAVPSIASGCRTRKPASPAKTLLPSWPMLRS